MTSVYTAAPDSLEEIQKQKRVGEVHIDGLVSFMICVWLHEFISRLVVFQNIEGTIKNHETLR